MLAGHPELFSPPEMVIAPFATMAERRKKLDERFWEKGGLRRAIMELQACGVDEAKAVEASLEERTVPEVYAWIQAQLGERVLVDKCPHLSADPAALSRLARWFPAARWVWIVRHPGSVTRSIENMPMAEVMLQGYAPDARDIWYFANRTIQSFLGDIPEGRKATIRYEDMVGDGRKAMHVLCRDIGLTFHEALLTPYEGDRMREGPSGARAVGDPNLAGHGKVDPSLATKWLEGFDPSSVSPDTHRLARELGYDLGALAAPPMASVSSAMAALFDSARKLESDMRMPSDLDAVEGRRFLLRMLSMSVDLMVEQGDPDRPQFHHAEGPTRKMFADNPDADYWRAPVRLGDGRRYRVSGTVPAGTTYIGILYYRKGGVVGRYMPDREFVKDGRFELILSAGEGADFRGEGDETAVMVRQYFADRAVEAPIDLHIEFLGHASPSALEPRDLARDLDRARRNLEAVFARTLGTWQMARVGLLNRFVQLDGAALFPTPDNTYLACWYRFGRDQVMYIRGKAPGARYWSYCLYNVWMESGDYRHARVSLNHAQVTLDGDRYEICLAHRDPGHPNWIDTTGHLAGYVLLRCLLPEGDIEVPTIEVKYEAEISRSTPATR